MSIYLSLTQERYFNFFFGRAKFQADYFEILPGNIKVQLKAKKMNHLR